MELKKGDKQTEVGVIPMDWDVKNLLDNFTLKARIGWQGLTTEEYLSTGDYGLVTGTDFRDGYIDWDNCVYVEKIRYVQDKNIQLKLNDVLVTKDGTIGKVAFVNKLPNPTTLNSGIFVVRPKNPNIDERFFYYILMSSYFDMFLSRITAGSTITHLYQKDFSTFNFILPPRSEQTAIANVLSDTDAYIISLEKLIEKKRQIKEGAMQELLKPKDGWELKKLGDIALILDNLRKPLNDSERLKMKGDIPYCGANNIVDYVNDYVIDDDIILMAEDGGNFDQYKTRPIAYRMSGKCWVNNHAHIVKSRPEIDQNFLFYSVVHKNILDYINGGTRAKLNKGELVNIEINIPPNKKQQADISKILDDFDSEINKQIRKLEKAKSIKGGMMQQLLTGKIRLK